MELCQAFNYITLISTNGAGIPIAAESGLKYVMVTCQGRLNMKELVKSLKGMK